LNGDIYEISDSLFYDDEGLSKPPPLSLFRIDVQALIGGLIEVKIPGKALVVGSDADAESIATMLTVADVAANVKWLA
jgi:hypothetical protein